VTKSWSFQIELLSCGRVNGLLCEIQNMGGWFILNARGGVYDGSGKGEWEGGVGVVRSIIM